MPVRDLFAEFSKRMITFDGYAMCGDKSSGVRTLQNNNNNKKSRERERERERELEREGKLENEKTSYLPGSS